MNWTRSPSFASAVSENGIRVNWSRRAPASLAKAWSRGGWPARPGCGASLDTANGRARRRVAGRACCHSARRLLAHGVIMQFLLVLDFGGQLVSFVHSTAATFGGRRWRKEVPSRQADKPQGHTRQDFFATLQASWLLALFRQDRGLERAGIGRDGASRLRCSSALILPPWARMPSSRRAMSSGWRTQPFNSICPPCGPLSATPFAQHRIFRRRKALVDRVDAIEPDHVFVGPLGDFGRAWPRAACRLSISLSRPCDSCDNSFDRLASR